MTRRSADARAASGTAGRSLHVGYVLKVFPRLSETFVLDEILGVQASGAEVSIFSLRPAEIGPRHQDVARLRGCLEYLPPFDAASILDGLGAVPAPGSDGRDRALAFLDLLPPERRPMLLVQALSLAQRVRSRRLDHLHAHFLTVAAHTAYLAHLLTGVPFSVTCHAKDIYRDAVDRRVFREVAGAASAVVTVCEANRRWIEEHLLAGHPARLIRVYNGVFLDQVPPPTAARQPGLVLGVGRLVEKKGFHVLLEACRILADRGVPFRCVVVGDGEEAPRLADLRCRLGLQDHVELAGSIPRHEVLDWMSRARVLAAPCLTGTDGNRDALPTVLLEALALGLPAVSTPVGGIPEIIEPGVEGEIVPEGGVEALAAALQRMLTDDLLWRRYAAAGPVKAARRFDRRRTLPELLDVFRGDPVDEADELPA